MSLNFIDLFAGCGGMTLGFQNAGFNAVAAVDNWDPAIKVYRSNFTHEIHKLDLSDVQASLRHLESYQFDMVIGGPPCQDFSHAGKRNEELGRADLTVNFAEIVANIRPKWFVMENVDRTVKSQRYKFACKILRDAEYSLTQRILDANMCRVPQRRKRLFLIGELGLSLSVGNNSLGSYLDNGLCSVPMSVRDYFGDHLDIDHYYRHPRNYNRRAIFSVDEPSPTVRGVNRPIPSTYKMHPNDTAPISDKLRPLTTLERSYIQTFPRSFKFKGSKTDLEQMIGNAVPVNQAEYIAHCIKTYIIDKGNTSEPRSCQTVQLLLFRES